MKNFMELSSVLVLNSLYFPIGVVNPKQAMTQVNGLSESGTVAKLIDVSYVQKPDGSFNLEEVEYFQPCTFAEWIKLSIRPGIDTDIIHTAHLQIRTPQVLITSYSKIPKKRFRPNKNTLWELQGGRCGYTLEPSKYSQLNLEHKIPQSHGGRSTFENLILVKKELNFKRGNRPMEEFNLSPKFSHKEPAPIPYQYTIKNILRPDWAVFIKK